MDPVGFDPVTLECEQHSLPPRGIEPGVYTHVVAYKHAVQSETRVAPLDQEAQLQILQISVALHTQIGVSWVGHRGAADPLGQRESCVAAGAPSPILCGTGVAAGAVPHGTGDQALARRVVVGAGAAAALLTVNTNLLVLAAVQHGESVAQPEVQGPEGEMTSHSVCIKFRDATLLHKDNEKCISQLFECIT